MHKRISIHTVVEYIAVIVALIFCMAAGAACMHQHEVLNRKPKAVRVYINDEPVKLSEPQEQTITGIKVVSEADELAEELYYDSLELLAICVEAEAGNQGIEGKRLVASVILNRVESDDFPDSITEVITQPHHFTSYWNGAMDKAVPTEETFEVVRRELENRTNKDILYFTAGGWPEYGTPWRQVGDHYFSTE